MLICMRGRRRSALLVHSRREEAGTSPVQALAAQSWPYQEAGVRSLGGQWRPGSERAAWLLAARLNTAPDCNPYHRCSVIRAHIQCSEVCHLRCCEMAQYNHLFFSAVIVCSVNPVFSVWGVGGDPTPPCLPVWTPRKDMLRCAFDCSLVSAFTSYSWICAVTVKEICLISSVS